MNATLRDSVRAGLALPLVLVAVLAGALGFVTARMVSDATPVARVSVITTRGEVTPPPSEEPVATPEEDETTGSSGRRGRSCPSRCECDFPPGGLIVRCGGKSVSTSMEPDTQVQQPSGELPRERFDLPAMD